MGEQAVDTKPYDSTFKTLMRYCTELLVALVNYAFGKRFDLGEAVTFLQSEVYVTDESGERRPRTADSVFRLAEHTYHMECQSYGEGTIQIRLVEMGFGVAVRERVIGPGIIETEYPCQAVLYLTCPQNTPDAITMRLKLPTGQTAEWEIPAIKLSELGLDEIFDSGLYFLLAFCLFWYGRDGLKRCNGDASRLAGMNAMIDDVRSRLRKAMEEGKISDFNLCMVLDAMRYVSQKLAVGYDNVMEAVKEKMGEYPMSDGLIEFPTLRRLREAREEGRSEGMQEGEKKGMQEGRREGMLLGRQEGMQEGEKKGMLSTLFGLVRDNLLTAQNAADRAKLSLNAFNAKMAEYEAGLQA